MSWVMRRCCIGTVGAVGIAMSVGCGEAPALGAPVTGGPATTSTTSGASTSTEGEDESETTVAQPEPDLGTPLPEGCGDGVPVAGQFCFTPVPLPEYGHVNLVLGLDLDGDGRDEIIVNDAESPGYLLPLFYDGASFVEGGVATGMSTSHAPLFTDIDFDGNGRPDIVRSYSGAGWAKVVTYLSLGGSLERESYEFGAIADSAGGGGSPVVLDVDGDGMSEILASDTEYGARLFRWDGAIWEPVGPHMDMPGCNQKGSWVVGDFDGDGAPDALVDTGGTYCNAGPPSYDPDWHRIAVFRTDRETGLVELTHTMPAGTMLETGAWKGDLDDDGHLDAVFDPWDGPGVVLLMGRGDGTFEDARVIRDLEGSTETWSVRDVGDFDGDGRLEFSARVDGQLAFVLDLAGEPHASFLGPPFRKKIWPAADFNGDGIADLAVEDDDRPNQGLLLLSTP